jgi:GT2 family glycosyltransferase
MILLRNNIVLNVRVQEAEARAAEAERRFNEMVARLTRNAAPVPETQLPPEAAVAAAEAAEQPGNEPEPAGEPEQAAEPALPHRIAGMVEAPGRLPDVITDGILIISGWTLTEAGDATIEAFIDGEPPLLIPYGEPRPDADQLYPGYPAGANCGFMTEVQVGHLPDGMHDLMIRISASDGAQAELKTTFEIDNHAYEKGRVIGRLDLPVRGTLFHPREAVPVSGWVLAPSGMRSLVALVDGEPRGRVDYGSLRPDIAARRRQYADADHCGFSGSVPLFGLPDGSHEFVLVATANDGQKLEMPTRIEIDSAAAIDGGVPVINRHYRAWRERRASAAANATAEPIHTETRRLVEAIVPLEGASDDALDALAASLLAQSHRDWRLTLVDAGDASDATRLLARRLDFQDGRVSYREPVGNGIVDGVNAALDQSEADWITLVRPGIILSPVAIERVVHSLAHDPTAVLIYTDDDRIDPESTERWNPFFKPDWSPDLVLAMNYLGPLTLFDRAAAVAAGGLRAGYTGAESYDLALRVTDGSSQVLHVPEVLATTIEEAPAIGAPWHRADWQDAEQRALADTLSRRGIAGAVERGLHPGTWRVRYAVPEPPGVTAVIPTGGKLHLLRPCLFDLLERTDYPKLEVLLVDNSHGTDVERLVAELAPTYPNVRRVVDDRTPFNYSALINAAVPHVNTPYMLMLNDDITVIDSGWLQAMVEHARRPEVGIVGAKLLYPDDTIQHAGVILGPFGGSVHVFKRLPGDDPGFFDLPDVVRNCSAVTFACAVIDRAVFEEIGGMDEVNLPVAFNDTDFCLRAREAGYEVIYTPHATLYHHESVTKTVIAHPHEIAFLRNRWGHIIDHDPYYNPNLTRKGEDARLDMETISAA